MADTPEEVAIALRKRFEHDLAAGDLSWTGPEHTDAITAEALRAAEARGCAKRLEAAALLADAGPEERWSKVAIAARIRALAPKAPPDSAAD